MKKGSSIEKGDIVVKLFYGGGPDYINMYIGNYDVTGIYIYTLDSYALYDLFGEGLSFSLEVNVSQISQLEMHLQDGYGDEFDLANIRMIVNSINTID